MLVKDLQRHIINKDVGGFYLFTGAETWLMSLYTRQIAKALNLPLKHYDTADKAVKALTTTGLFDVDAVAVVWGDDSIAKAGEDKWQQLLTISGTLILVMPSVDKRIKFFNYFDELNVVEFAKLPPAAVAATIKDPAFTQGERLAIMCNCDTGRTLLEYKKIKTFSEVTGTPVDAVFESFVNVGAIYDFEEMGVFDFTNTVAARDLGCYEQAQKLIAQGDQGVRLISLLYGTFRNLLLIKSTRGKQNSNKMTGLNFFIIDKLLPYINQYTIEELVAAVHILREAEQGVKRGKLDADIALDYCLVKIL